jgi:hypothetical protein
VCSTQNLIPAMKISLLVLTLNQSTRLANHICLLEHIAPAAAWHAYALIKLKSLSLQSGGMPASPVATDVLVLHAMQPLVPWREGGRCTLFPSMSGPWQYLPMTSTYIPS